MRKWSRLAGVLIVAIGALPAGANVGVEGRPPFAFSAWFLDPPSVEQAGHLRVLVGGSYQDTAVAEARIHLPAGLIITSGDTVLTVSGAADPEWIIGIRAAVPGRYEIRGELRVQDMAGGVDEGEWLMPVEVRPDTTIVRSSVDVRQEYLRGGQRYRYGGQYLVPIDGREDFVERDIDPRAGRPKVLDRVAAVDSLRQGSRSSTVAFVVFIDSQGKIRGARPLGTAAGDDRMVALARQTLEAWRFAPAVTRSGRPVTDWIEVQVEVRPGR